MATATRSGPSDPTSPQQRHHIEPFNDHAATLHDFTNYPTSSLDSPVRSTPDCASIPKRRSSAFFEAGLTGEDAFVDARLRRASRPSLRVRFRSKVDIHESEVDDADSPVFETQEMPPFFPTMPRIMFFVLILAVIIPSLGNSPFFKAGVSPIGAKAGVVKVPIQEHTTLLPTLDKRQDTETDVCTRWSGQSAVVNGTMYYYGGRVSTSAGQSSNQWSKSVL